MSANLRLQKYLAQCGVASRRGSEELILQGKVAVNGHIVSVLGTKVNPLSDRVFVDGKRVKPQTLRFYKFHKPAKVVSTMSDEHNRTCIADFIKNLEVQVFPVGRLDYDVTGLLLLTNDGDFANRLLHPSYEIRRTYVAKVEGKPTKSVLNRLIKGIELEDGSAKALDINILSPKDFLCRHIGQCDERSSALCVTVGEGRNHFVKRILEAIGHPVIRLSRVQYGKFSLGKLPKAGIIEVKNYKNYID